MTFCPSCNGEVILQIYSNLYNYNQGRLELSISDNPIEKMKTIILPFLPELR